MMDIDEIDLDDQLNEDLYDVIRDYIKGEFDLNDHYVTPQFERADDASGSYGSYELINADDLAEAIYQIYVDGAKRFLDGCEFGMIIRSMIYRATYSAIDSSVDKLLDQWMESQEEPYYD